MMQRMDPTQSIMANQFVISFRNLIQAGVFFFSGSLLSPYYALRRTAASVRMPFYRLVPKRCTSSSSGILCSSMLWICPAFSSAFRSSSSFSFLGFSA